MTPKRIWLVPLTLIVTCIGLEVNRPTPVAAAVVRFIAPGAFVTKSDYHRVVRAPRDKVYAEVQRYVDLVERRSRHAGASEWANVRVTHNPDGSIKLIIPTTGASYIAILVSVTPQGESSVLAAHVEVDDPNCDADYQGQGVGDQLDAVANYAEQQSSQPDWERTSIQGRA